MAEHSLLKGEGDHSSSDNSAASPAGTGSATPAGPRQTVGPDSAGAEPGAVSKLLANLESVVLGRQEVVRLALTALLAGEHILLEDVPGVGKTLVGKALARSVDGEFCRIQFTPDLLPSDIVGSSVYHAKDAEFVFNRGPLFANIVLADEINRAPPRTQSALLEGMSDGQVSVDGVTHPLPRPFMVIATQNPFEFEGTYALPESQLDRFLLRISVGYPSRQDELRVLRTHRTGEPVQQLRPVVHRDQVIALQAAVREVRFDDTLNGYLLDLVEATRRHPELSVGVSIRGALSLYRAAQAWATLEGRAFVTPDDIKRLVVPTLAHRVILRGAQHAGRRDVAERTLQEIVARVAPPI